jgi:hypothetical protein
MAKFISSDTKRISLNAEGYNRGYNAGGETTTKGPHVIVAMTRLSSNTPSLPCDVFIHSCRHWYNGDSARS